MKINTEVNHGILFLRFDGEFDSSSFNEFDKEINYLLYNQGISYYTFNFRNVNKIDERLIFKIQNKLVEIFLSCGKVVVCGLNKFYQKKIGSTSNKIFYVDDERDAFNLLNL